MGGGVGQAERTREGGRARMRARGPHMWAAELVRRMAWKCSTVGTCAREGGGGGGGGYQRGGGIL